MSTKGDVIVKRTFPPVSGVSQYAVTRGDVILGYVEGRRGGWWRATDKAGNIRGSLFLTRRDAVSALTESR